MHQKTSVWLIILIFIIAMPSIVRAQEDYLIIIRLSEFKLVLMANDGTSQEYVVATPTTTPKSLPVEATVRSVQINPSWNPTAPTREAYLRRTNMELPISIKPGDPRNAMGRGIIRLNYLVPGSMDPNVVIHGTNDEKSIGKKVSRGCIRMHNDDIEKIIRIIQNKKTKVIFAE